MSVSPWKERLASRIAPELAAEIDTFEGQIELKKEGKLEDKFFAETRLRRGAYGQRYDNGLRDDGTGQKRLEFPTELTKGPDTMWDAPGMMRVKILTESSPPSRWTSSPTWPKNTGLHPAHHDPSGHPASLHPHRGHAGPHASPRRRGHHDERGLRKLGPQRDGLPVCRRLQRSVVRRDPLRARVYVLLPRASRRPRLRS